MKNQSSEVIVDVFAEMAKLQGHVLNGQDRMLIRTRVAAAVAAKERHRQRMNSADFEWRKPQKMRR